MTVRSSALCYHTSEEFMLLILLQSALAQTPPSATGEVFVDGPAGAAVLVDGTHTGRIAPVTLSTLPVGDHVIGVRLGCAKADVTVAVRAGAIERPVFQLADGVGTLGVRGAPPGAAFVLDGKPLVVGAEGSATVACGAHTVSAESPGFAPRTLTVTVPLDARIDVDLPLDRIAAGTVTIAVDPVDAEIRLDGARHGVGPMTIEGVTAGTHQVEAVRQGMSPARRSVDVVADQLVRVDLVLTARPPLSERLGLDRVHWGHVGVAGGLTAGAAAAGLGSWLLYQQAVANYQDYAALSYQDDTDAFYAEEVATPRAMAIGSGVLGGLLGAGATVAWITLRMDPETSALSPVVGPGGVGVSGTF